MPRINLLPWREELRQKRKKDFLMALLGAALFGVLLTYGSKLVVGSWIDNQQARNDLLQTEITALEKQIEDILGLENERDRLIQRMRVIEQLQQSRPLSVHLVDELVKIVPDGVYLTKFEQKDTHIEMTGMAESNARISTLLRNIEASPWLKDYGFERAERTNVGNRQLYEFTVTAEQVPMSGEDEE